MSLLVNKMRIQLPISIDPNDSFLKKVDEYQSDNSTRLKRIYNDSSVPQIDVDWYCHSENQTSPYRVDVKHSFYGNGDYEVYPIEQIEIIDWHTIDENDRSIEIGGYLVMNTRFIIEPWGEPLVRLNNVFVCYLNQMISNKALHRAYPTANYVAGEIFVKGAKGALKITRESFDTTSEHFSALWNKLVDIFSPVFKKAAYKYRLRSEAERFFVEEQKNLPAVVKGAINSITEIWGTNDKSEIESKFAYVERDSPEILTNRTNLDEYLRIHFNEDVLIRESLTGSDEKDNVAYYLRASANVKEPEIESMGPNLQKGVTSQYRILVNPRFFAPTKIIVDNIGSISVIPKKGGPDDPSFETSLSSKPKRVFINYFNKSIRGYSVSVFEVEAILKTAAADAENKAEFLEKALSRLRRSFTRETRKSTHIISSFLEQGE